MNDTEQPNPAPTDRSPDFVVRPLHGLIRTKARIDNIDGVCLARVIDRAGFGRTKVYEIVPTDQDGKPDRTDPLLQIRARNSKRYELLTPDGEAFGVIQRKLRTLALGGEQLTIWTGPDDEMTEIREIGHLQAALSAAAAVLIPVPLPGGKREFEVIANHRVATLIRRTAVSGLRVEIYLDEPDPSIDTLTLLAAACILREFLV